MSICLILANQAKAQTDTDNPFYGLKTNTHVRSFEQIYKNLSDGVDKHSDGKAKLLGYKYVGKVENGEDVKKMVRKNLLNAPQYSREVKRAELYIDTLVIDHSRYIYEPSKLKMSKVLKTSEGQGVFKHICEEIQVGYDIYKLSYQLDERKYEEYVFVNPDDMQVVTSCSFWGFHLRDSQQASWPVGAWTHVDTSKDKDKEKEEKLLDANTVLRNIEQAKQQDKFLQVVSGDVIVRHAYPTETKMLNDGKCLMRFKIYDNHYHPVKLFLNVTYSGRNNSIKLQDYQVEGICSDGVALLNKKNKDFVSLTYDDRSKCFLGYLQGTIDYLSSGGLISNSIDSVLMLHILAQ